MMKLSEYTKKIKPLYIAQKHMVGEYGYCVLFNVEYDYSSVDEYKDQVRKNLKMFVQYETLESDISIDEAMKFLES